MSKWSYIRKKLENEYLAENLHGHIKYFATTYSYSPDHEGRAAILFDGEEILKGNYYNQWHKAHLFPHDEKYEKRMELEHPFIDETALDLGCFDQRSFYRAFEEFDNQSIEKSMESENLLVKIFALLDRRIGKRRLYKMKESIKNQPQIIQFFYEIRMEAENLQ